MESSIILLRYGELALKSPYVRRSFEHALVQHIKQTLQYHDISNTISQERGRLFVSTLAEKKTIALLQRIFGITSVSPVFQTTSSLDDISQTAGDLLKNKLRPSRSFAVRVARTGTHAYTSQEAATRIGQHLVDTTGAPVNLSQPAIELLVDIREKKAYLFLERFPGMGGLPFGTQGKVLAVIDSRQSLLAMWFLLRRGCTPILANISCSQDIINNFCIYWNIYQYKSFNISTCNRKELVPLIEYNQCNAVVTGHTFSEEAIQEIHTLKKDCAIPIFTPLIPFTQDEINEQMNRVGATS